MQNMFQDKSAMIAYTRNNSQEKSNLNYIIFDSHTCLNFKTFYVWHFNFLMNIIGRKHAVIYNKKKFQMGGGGMCCKHITLKYVRETLIPMFAYTYNVLRPCYLSIPYYHQLHSCSHNFICSHDVLKLKF